MPNRRKKPPPQLPPNAVLEEKGDLHPPPPALYWIPLSVFFSQTVHCTANQVHRSFSDHFSDLLFLGTVHGLAPPESGRELADGGDGNGGRGRAGTRGRGAGRALALDWVSVDFTWQRTRQPPLLSSHDYIPVKRFRKEGGLARDFQVLEM